MLVSHEKRKCVSCPTRDAERKTSSAMGYAVGEPRRTTALTPVEKYAGHREFEEGHVHHLPLTGVWNVVCHFCPGDILFGRSGRFSATTLRSGLAWLENHVADHREAQSAEDCRG